ncbi:MAG TPA: hypothetical protein PK970_00665 [Hyphomicrobiaceae bacterium]|nr:hypothetical protein [Hyphomicrobiaceae bacterium]
MQEQTCTLDYVSGFCNIVIDFELHGRIFEALASHETTAADVVNKAFLELANLGNDFSIVYHTFEMDVGGTELRFVTQSRRYRPGDRLYIIIGLVGEDVEAAKLEMQRHFELWMGRVEALASEKH